MKGVPDCSFSVFEDGTYTVTLKIDPHGYFLYWNHDSESFETEILDIMSIRDTRTGRYAKVPKDPRVQASFGNNNLTSLESKSLCVVYGYTFVDLSFYNFVGQKPDTVKLWADAIMAMAYNLLALNSSPANNLRKAHTKLVISKDKHGMIPVKNIMRVFARHADDKKRVEQALEQTGLPTGKNKTMDVNQFTFDVFLEFYRKLTSRVEVEKIFCQLTNQSHRKPSKAMSVEQLVTFLNDYQRDPRLNEILYPYADNNRAKEVIQLYEPSKENIARKAFTDARQSNYSNRPQPIPGV
ncbi:Phosphoinositide-specific phospholipase C EF-hand-like domain [Trinorchestia longiramus]|nr:Phosphoinositide-specific phospholipase C EF-hand-like domain [Trinorchestia longiramus]